MDREQKHHDKHEREREEKKALERRSEEDFAKPGPAIHPLWFLAIGILLTLGAILVWMQL